MVIDTSAIVAILTREEEAAEFSFLIATAAEPCTSAATLVEATLVLTKIPRTLHLLDSFLSDSRIEIIPLTPAIAVLARQACQRYGRGTRAGLNFGDLFSYATAKALSLPLLFKGKDFAHTDVSRVALKT